MALAKPQMRGLLAGYIKKHLVLSVVFASSLAGLYKFLVYDVRKQKYADFYKNYDAVADYNRMKRIGVFHSATKRMERD